MEEHLQLAQTFLEDAAHLIGSGGYRSMLSRSYYAVYHAAIALFLKHGLSPGNFLGRSRRPATRWEHGLITRNFFIEFVHRRQLLEWAVGGQIRALYSDRARADYEPGIRIVQADAEATLATAQALVMDIEEWVRK